jgi:hypothetical protein
MFSAVRLVFEHLWSDGRILIRAHKYIHAYIHIYLYVHTDVFVTILPGGRYL